MQPEHTKHHTHQYTAYPGDYPSNPFTTAFTGVKTLYKNGVPVGIGVIGMQFLLMMMLWFGAFIALLAFFVLFFGIAAHFEPLQNPMFMPKDILETAKNFTPFAPIAGIMGLIALAITILGYVFIQAIQTVFIGKAVAWRQKPSFSDVIETAFKRILPLTAQVLIVIGIAIPALILLQVVLYGLLSISLAFLAIVIPLTIVATVGTVYVMARLAFSGLAVLLDNMGPWKAIKHSFALTKGRVGEVLGIVAVGALFITAAMIFTTLIQIATIPAPLLGVLFSFITFGVTLLCGYAFMAAITERYAQLKSAQHTNTPHQTEWGSTLAAIVLASIVFTIAGGVQTIHYSLTQKGLDSVQIDGFNELRTNPTEEQIYDQYSPDMTQQEVDDWIRRLHEAQAEHTHLQ